MEESSNQEFSEHRVGPTVTPETLRKVISYTSQEIDNLRSDVKELVLIRKEMMKQLKRAEIEISELETQWLMEVQ